MEVMLDNGMLFALPCRDSSGPSMNVNTVSESAERKPVSFTFRSAVVLGPWDRRCCLCVFFLGMGSTLPRHESFFPSRRREMAGYTWKDKNWIPGAIISFPTFFQRCKETRNRKGGEGERASSACRHSESRSRLQKLSCPFKCMHTS